MRRKVFKKEGEDPDIHLYCAKKDNVFLSERRGRSSL